MIPSNRERLQRMFSREYALSAADAAAAAASPELAAYVTACMQEAAAIGAGSKAVIDLITGVFLSRLAELKIPHSGIPVRAPKPAALVRIAALSAAGKLSGAEAAALLTETWDTGRPPEDLLKERRRGGPRR